MLWEGRRVQKTNPIPDNRRFISEMIRYSAASSSASKVTENRMYDPASSQGTVEINFSVMRYFL